jgi:hypothetical protein
MLGVLTCHGGAACSVASTISSIIALVVMAGVVWGIIRWVAGKARNEGSALAHRDATARTAVVKAASNSVGLRSAGAPLSANIAPAGQAAAAPESVYKTCPDCAEQVLAAARKCRFCGYGFEVDDEGPSDGTRSLLGPGLSSQQAAASQASASARPAFGDSFVPTQDVPAASPPRPLPAATTRRVNSLAVASFILALVGLLVGSVLALVFGYRAKSHIDRSNGAEKGRGLAVAGIILGWVQLAALVVLLVVVAVIASLKTPLERAIGEGADVAKTYAYAQFDYLSEHGTYATAPKVLVEQYGAESVSPSEEVRVAFASSDSYCMVTYLHRGVSSFGYPYNVTLAVWSDSPEEWFWGRGWTCRGFPSTPPAPWTPPAPAAEPVPSADTPIKATPKQAAVRLFLAWSLNDKVGARQVATAVAVRRIWSNEYESTDIDQGNGDCDKHSGDVWVCTLVAYVPAGAEEYIPYGIVMTVADDPVIGYRVRTVRFVADG